MGFALNGGFQIVGRPADGQARRGVTDGLQKLEVAVRVARFALRCRAENRGDIVIALNVGLLGEIEITSIRLALPEKASLRLPSVRVFFKFVIKQDSF